MSKRSKACDISSKVRKQVIERDKYCIICGVNRNLQIAHYISRARGGLGIPQNLGLLCINCHSQYDNGKLHNEIKKTFKAHLKEHYPDWDEQKLIYSKWN
jgi:5-methylcytosine-specific restriction endonuclease McrA